jgi:hypothetical protein
VFKSWEESKSSLSQAKPGRPACTPVNASAQDLRYDIKLHLPFRKKQFRLLAPHGKRVFWNRRQPPNTEKNPLLRRTHDTISAETIKDEKNEVRAKFIA